MSETKNKNLKVYGISYEVNNPQGYYASSKMIVPIPQIRIQGKWLEDCGFNPGVPVTVHCDEGKLIIKVNDINGLQRIVFDAIKNLEHYFYSLNIIKYNQTDCKYNKIEYNVRETV